jgi:hypothetical protein
MALTAGLKNNPVLWNLPEIVAPLTQFSPLSALILKFRVPRAIPRLDSAVPLQRVDIMPHLRRAFPASPHPLKILTLIDVFFLCVDGDRNVGDAAIRQRWPARKGNNVFDMACAHDSGVVDGNIHEHLIQLDILLSMRLNEIVILQPRDREHRLPVQLRIVKTIQQMQAART